MTTLKIQEILLLNNAMWTQVPGFSLFQLPIQLLLPSLDNQTDKKVGI